MARPEQSSLVPDYDLSFRLTQKAIKKGEHLLITSSKTSEQQIEKHAAREKLESGRLIENEGIKQELRERLDEHKAANSLPITMPIIVNGIERGFMTLNSKLPIPIFHHTWIKDAPAPSMPNALSQLPSRNSLPKSELVAD